MSTSTTSSFTLELVPRHHDRDPLPRVAISLSRYRNFRATSHGEIAITVDLCHVARSGAILIPAHPSTYVAATCHLLVCSFNASSLPNHSCHVTLTRDPLPHVVISLSRYGNSRATSHSDILLAVRSVPCGTIWCDLETCLPLHLCRCHVSSSYLFEAPLHRIVIAQSLTTCHIDPGPAATWRDLAMVTSVQLRMAR